MRKEHAVGGVEAIHTKRVPLIFKSTLLQGEAMGMWRQGEARKYHSRGVCIWVETSLWKQVYEYGDSDFVILNIQLLGSYQNS
jgi:hypothetical protein